MVNHNLNDTIAAISTGIGEAGISIVRMSGKDALNISDKIFVSKDNKKPLVLKTHTLHYGWIVKSAKCKVQSAKFKAQSTKFSKPEEFIDEVILTAMLAPRSYTKEDIIEINCHGGIVATRAVLDLILENGARLAEPGEFTKRAFLNGRIDLSQAEAVLDIIQAKTDAALRIGTEQLRGVLSYQINNFIKRLLETLALLEANIDFPEDDTSLVDFKDIVDNLNYINKELKNILESAKRGRIIREGIHVVICGRPNVGKSSLLNALLRQERSIVTPIAGTTRDTIEEIIDINGIPVRIVDTAGIIEPRDLIERKAVQRSKRYIDLADLVILLFDGNKKMTQDDMVLIRRLKKKPVIAIINKIDLKQNIEKERITRVFSHVIEISARKLKNIKLLEERITNSAYNAKINPSEPVIVSNLRHIEKIKKTQKLIEEAVDSLDNKLSLEFVAQDIKDALLCLDEILGKKFSENLLDKIFSEFCIGK